MTVFGAPQSAQNKSKVRSAQNYLSLRHTPKAATWHTRTRGVLRSFYLKTIHLLARSARRAHNLMLGLFSSPSISVFLPVTLKNITAMSGQPDGAEFDFASWKISVEPLTQDYAFVPRDAIQFHSNARNNHFRVHKLEATIALFPASHPLLMFPEEGTFLFEKLHEVPHHGPGAPLHISDFRWTSLIRPDFKLNVGLHESCRIYDFLRPAIYIGGSLNYGHFITDYYPKFLAIEHVIRRSSPLRKRLPKLVIVFCEDGELDYLERTHPEFEFFNLKGYGSTAIQAKELYTTNFIPFPLACELLRRQFQGKSLAAPGQVNPSIVGVRKVYLSRRGFARRRVENEEELIAMLEALGFDILDVKAHTIEYLSQRLKHYDTVVSNFGAHTINAIFLPPGSTFFEIVPRSFDASHGWQYNHALFMSAGLHYVRYISDDASSSIKGMDDETGIFDWESRVDVDDVKDRLEQIGLAG